MLKNFKPSELGKALIASIGKWNEDIFNALLDADADVNATNRKGRSVLCLSIGAFNYKATEILIKKKAKLNIQSASLSRLIESHADFDFLLQILDWVGDGKWEGDGLAALNEGFYAAAMENNWDLMDIFLKAGADVNFHRDGGKTTLMFAAERGRKKLVEKLIKAKANVNLQMRQGHNALMFATEEGYLDIINLLLEAKANPEAQNEIKVAAGGKVHGHVENRLEILEHMKEVEKNRKHDSVDMSYFYLPTMISYNEVKWREVHESFNTVKSEDIKIEDTEVDKEVKALLPANVDFEDM